jgi:hypothetical protein
MVDPSLGPVNVYNNIVTNSGTGPEPGGTNSGYEYAAISVNGDSTTAVQVYNNTINDAGAFGGAGAGAIRAFGQIELYNNIFCLLSGEQYVSTDTNLSRVSGTHNLFYGAGNPLGVFSDSVVGHPWFVGNGDYHLQATSLAIDAGTTVNLATDYDGVLRPQGLAYDIGAYEYPTKASTAEGTLTASPASLAFGTVTVGQSDTTTTTLSNTGTGSVTISQANSNNVNFKTSGITFPLTLDAGQSATLTVTFAPTSSGAQSATIAVASNAKNSPMNIAVTGTGSGTTTSHEVSISWTEASTSVSGYNVYRSTQSGSGYDKLNGSLLTGKSYGDGSVIGGQTYYYVVTAVDETGKESAYSAQVSAAVPAS